VQRKLLFIAVGLYSCTLVLHADPHDVAPKYDWRTSFSYRLIDKAHALSMRAVRYCRLPITPKPTVIVVDDDLSVRRALRMQLQVAGFNVLVFQSGESLLGSDFPTNDTCLLLDIYMPGMSGSDDQLTRRVMSESEAVASLFKPFDQKVLLHAIRKALRSHSKSTR
jgi:DNA-binding response OmpR family regulator